MISAVNPAICKLNSATLPSSSVSLSFTIEISCAHLPLALESIVSVGSLEKLGFMSLSLGAIDCILEEAEVRLLIAPGK